LTLWFYHIKKTTNVGVEPILAQHTHLWAPKTINYWREAPIYMREAHILDSKRKAGPKVKPSGVIKNVNEDSSQKI
jgi:hypothetical protein